MSDEHAGTGTDEPVNEPGHEPPPVTDPPPPETVEPDEVEEGEQDKEPA